MSTLRIKRLESIERKARASIRGEASHKWAKAWTYEKYIQLVQLRGLINQSTN